MENKKIFFIHHFLSIRYISVIDMGNGTLNFRKIILRAITESLVRQYSCKDQSKW